MKKREWSSETAQAVCQETGLHDPVQGAILLAERFMTAQGVTHAARSLDFLASALDAKIQPCTMREAGQLVFAPTDEASFLIMVNEAHSHHRQKFSACHEMGHLLMPNYDPMQGRRVDWDTMRWDPEEEEEFLCNVIAAEMLMPRRIFTARLRGCGLGIAALEELAQEFETSLEATILNIVQAGLSDVAAIIWEWDYSKADAASAGNLALFSDDSNPAFAPVEKKPRVKRVHTHGAMSDFFFPFGRSVENDSLVARAAELLQREGESSLSQVCGLQRIRCKRDNADVEPEFYIESRAYWTRKDGNLEPRVITLLFLQAPNNNDCDIDYDTQV